MLFEVWREYVEQVVEQEEQLPSSALSSFPLCWETLLDLAAVRVGHVVVPGLAEACDVGTATVAVEVVSSSLVEKVEDQQASAWLDSQEARLEHLRWMAWLEVDVGKDNAC